MALDDLDKQLIVELQRDGRASFADLAPLIGLSPAATRQRVQRLINDGIVRVVGVTDPMTMGYPMMAGLRIGVTGDVRTVADRISELPGVIYVVFTSGPFDLLVEVLAADAAALHDVINDHIRPIDGVRSIESFVYFGTHTHRFGWAPRD